MQSYKLPMIFYFKKADGKDSKFEEEEEEENEDDK